jgi:hypothetical protein
VIVDLRTLPRHLWRDRVDDLHADVQASRFWARGSDSEDESEDETEEETESEVSESDSQASSKVGGSVSFTCCVSSASRRKQQ